MPKERRLETLDLVGGSPTLDLANTLHSRVEPEHDYLRTYSDLVRWSVRAGTLHSDEIPRLEARASEAPDRAQRALERVIDLREAVYRVFSRLAHHDTPASDELETLIRAYTASIEHADFDTTPTGLVPRWDEADLARPIHELAYATGALLMSPAIQRVKECPSCSWLFLDASRNQSRRWCDMATCGSQDKMRRYYRSRPGRAARANAPNPSP